MSRQPKSPTSPSKVVDLVHRFEDTTSDAQTRPTERSARNPIPHSRPAPIPPTRSNYNRRASDGNVSSFPLGINDSTGQQEQRRSRVAARTKSPSSPREVSGPSRRRDSAPIVPASTSSSASSLSSSPRRSSQLQLKLVPPVPPKSDPFVPHHLNKSRSSTSNPFINRPQDEPGPSHVLSSPQLHLAPKDRASLPRESREKYSKLRDHFEKAPATSLSPSAAERIEHRIARKPVHSDSAPLLTSTSSTPIPRKALHEQDGERGRTSSDIPEVWTPWTTPKPIRGGGAARRTSVAEETVITSGVSHPLGLSTSVSTPSHIQQQRPTSKPKPSQISIPPVSLPPSFSAPRRNSADSAQAVTKRTRRGSDAERKLSQILAEQASAVAKKRNSMDVDIKDDKAPLGTRSTNNNRAEQAKSSARSPLQNPSPIQPIKPSNALSKIVVRGELDSSSIENLAGPKRSSVDLPHRKDSAPAALSTEVVPASSPGRLSMLLSPFSPISFFGSPNMREKDLSDSITRAIEPEATTTTPTVETHPFSPSIPPAVLPLAQPVVTLNILKAAPSPAQTTDIDLDPARITKFTIDPITEQINMFKPGASPVELPHLEEYLSQLPQIKFTYVDGEAEYHHRGRESHSRYASGGLRWEPKDLGESDPKLRRGFKNRNNGPPNPNDDIFPPFELVPPNITLDDLKQNITTAGEKSVVSQAAQNDLLGDSVDAMLTLEATTYGISFLNLEVLRDFIQFLSLFLTFVPSGGSSMSWLDYFTRVVPNTLSLNFADAFGDSLFFFVCFCVAAAIGMILFLRIVQKDPSDDIEGLEVSTWKLRSSHNRLINILIVFFLTTLYLPLSKLAVDALVWSDTFWPVANPYENGTDFPVLAPLGPSDIYRDPYDFCWVTSMKKSDINWAWFVLPSSAVVIGLLTIYFPWTVRRVVRRNLPKVDRFNDSGEGVLGKDADKEYIRLLAIDPSPYNFFYNGYKRKWGSWKAQIMAMKFLAILAVELVSKDNCVFRSFRRSYVETVRGILQLSITLFLFVIQFHNAPFLYESQNKSQLYSFTGSLTTSALAILIVQNIGPANVLTILVVVANCWICFVVVWFIVKEQSWYKTLVKKVQKRIDFSIEIFDKDLDLTKHVKRRIWQDSWTTLLLTGLQYRMPIGKVVAFSQSPYRPPYLLNFGGTVAERHVENLKVMRQIGHQAYASACAPLSNKMHKLRTIIMNNFVGPDMYYHPGHDSVHHLPRKIKTFFGKTYVVPFPFSVVFVYDEAEVVITLTKEGDMEEYVRQNEHSEIRRRRDVRWMLRALDGRMVVRYFELNKEGKAIAIGESKDSEGDKMCFQRGVLLIQRKKSSEWRNYNMNSGFTVTVTYTEGECEDPDGKTHSLAEAKVGEDELGITHDYRITPSLSQLFKDNRGTIEAELPVVRRRMQQYRDYYRDEARAKEETLSYGFLLNVYDNYYPDEDRLPTLLVTNERDPLIQDLPETQRVPIAYIYERLRVVNQSRLYQWWFLFWDDLYRKNKDEIEVLKRNPTLFDPTFKTAICYQPLPRRELEGFLAEKGAWDKSGKVGFLHSGVLNRMYIFMQDLVFGRRFREEGGWRRFEDGVDQREPLEGNIPQGEIGSRSWWHWIGSKPGQVGRYLGWQPRGQVAVDYDLDTVHLQDFEDGEDQVDERMETAGGLMTRLLGRKNNNQ